MIDYAHEVNKSLYGVVRAALRHGVRDGHHFILVFDTQWPGVVLSERMRSLHPVQMNVVIQHQFGDLAVSEGDIKVSLAFSDVWERLTIPFGALRLFADPEVGMALTFKPGAVGPAKAASRDNVVDFRRRLH